MQDMQRTYSVGLRLQEPTGLVELKPIDLGAVGGIMSTNPGAYRLITRGMREYWPKNGGMDEQPSLFRAYTRHKSTINLNEWGLAEHFPYTLNPKSIARGFGYAARIAAQIEGMRGYNTQFDPNLVRIGLGRFESNEDFEGQAGEAALALQILFYGGGTVTYGNQSLDFHLVLGDTSRLLEDQATGVFDTGKEFKAAASLEELVAKSGIRR